MSFMGWLQGQPVKIDNLKNSWKPHLAFSVSAGALRGCNTDSGQFLSRFVGYESKITHLVIIASGRVHVVTDNGLESFFGRSN